MGPGDKMGNKQTCLGRGATDALAQKQGTDETSYVRSEADSMHGCDVNGWSEHRKWGEMRINMQHLTSNNCELQTILTTNGHNHCIRSSIALASFGRAFVRKGRFRLRADRMCTT